MTTNAAWVQPITLEGRYVRLEPLAFSHHARLCEVGSDDLWRWNPAPPRTPEKMWAYIETALKAQAAGTALPFATVHRAAGRVVGSTRFSDIDSTHRHVEIGHTWIGVPWQRTAVNTEAKYLMLRHAFERLRCIRVQLRTDVLNQRSRNAIQRIGAKEEGILRSHMVTDRGRIRDSVCFSIIEAEWPAVKVGLEEKLARTYPPK